MSKSSQFPSCFRPPTTTTSAANHHSMTAAPPTSSNPNLTTSVYKTNLGLFTLTWSHTLLGRSLHLHLHLHHPSTATLSSPSSSSDPSFHLLLKPFNFWIKKGSKKLKINTATPKTIQIFWDLSKAQFGSRPEPQSGFYIAAVDGGAMTLLAGDSIDQAYAKTRASNSKPRRTQSMVLRREHVYGINKLYTTKASFGGKSRDISIDCRVNGDQKLCFSVDQERVLEIKHLKWKFRGNERIEVDGFSIQVSWDVYNWLFEDGDNGYALFMFKFEKLGFDDDEEEEDDEINQSNEMNGWSQQSCGFGFEKQKMMRKSLLRTARSSLSSSSSSVSSASSSGCSSVMEWASVEENELTSPCGFSLMVYAWKS
ncbi:hypothetical protein HYC85_027415 [Camellia sinensis]|uniref:DUF868 domain-containing protein n=1 Tax=Camellia sinensis TaxID=4442 RepID=A0A7J7GAD2_CAMSI|nr:hypothetical protein HYC85_027415 [Camellia sinensis]